MELRDSLSGAVFNNCPLAIFSSERLTVPMLSVGTTRDITASIGLNRSGSETKLTTADMAIRAGNELGTK
jgi:hypothetical protein